MLYHPQEFNAALEEKGFLKCVELGNEKLYLNKVFMEILKA
jgi:hypothetical protein